MQAPDIAATARRAADNIIAAVGAEPDAVREVVVLRYAADTHDPQWTGLPTHAAHEAYLAAVGRHLHAAGIRVIAVPFVREIYDKWRAGRVDSRQARADWASQYDGVRFAFSIGPTSIGWAVFLSGSRGSHGSGGEDPL